MQNYIDRMRFQKILTVKHKICFGPFKAACFYDYHKLRCKHAKYKNYSCKMNIFRKGIRLRVPSDCNYHQSLLQDLNIRSPVNYGLQATNFSCVFEINLMTLT